MEFCGCGDHRCFPTRKPGPRLRRNAAVKQKSRPNKTFWFDAPGNKTGLIGAGHAADRRSRDLGTDVALRLWGAIKFDQGGEVRSCAGLLTVFGHRVTAENLSSLSPPRFWGFGRLSAGKSDWWGVVFGKVGSPSRRATSNQLPRRLFPRETNFDDIAEISA